MDFLKLLESLNPKLHRLIKIINDESVSPELRKAAHKSAFDTISAILYEKVYDMTAWDMEIGETTPPPYDRSQVPGLARNLSDSIATGDFTNTVSQAETFMMTVVSAAQSGAFDTGASLGKYRTLTRTTTGKENCKWCDERAGIYVNPTYDDFKRHRKCDCRISVEGYQSRNGDVSNYMKS